MSWPQSIALMSTIVNSIWAMLVAVLFCCACSSRLEAAGANVDLTSFGAKPNDAHLNSRAAFQSALSALARQGGGILHVPSGEYFVDFPDIATDIDPRDPASRSIMAAENLTIGKLIIVPSNTTIEGETDSSGNPTSIIHWKVTSVPVFSLINADHSGLGNIAFVFDGTQPHFYPWNQEQYLAVVGVNAVWLGGGYELSTVIYTIGSERLTFENLSFTPSAKPLDNDHSFGFGIVANGKTPVLLPVKQVLAQLTPGARIPGGGLAGSVRGNTFKSLKFYGFVCGILATGQQDVVFENITGNWRGSWYRSFDPTRERGDKIQYIPGPGHLIYLSFQPSFDVDHAGERTVHDLIRNKNVTIRNIEEGSDTLSNFNSLGTLALKSIDGGTLQNVESHHPEGLIQTMADVHNFSAQDLVWTTQRDLCTEPDSKSNCSTPAILVNGQAYTSATAGFNDNVTFKNVTLRSSQLAARFQIDSPKPVAVAEPVSQNVPDAAVMASRSLPPARPSHHITVDGLMIECPPVPRAHQSDPRGIIQVTASDTRFTNVSYHALPTTNYSGPLNPAVKIGAGITNTAIDITIHSSGDPSLDSKAAKAIVEEHVPGNESVGLNNNSAITVHSAK